MPDIITSCDWFIMMKLREKAASLQDSDPTLGSEFHSGMYLGGKEGPV